MDIFFADFDMRRPLLVALSTGCVATSGQAMENCPAAEIISPARGATVSEPRPQIVWRTLPDVKRYRVQLESRVPEGRMITRFDTLVANTRFVPPSAVTEERAAIKVLVTADCTGRRTPNVIEEPALFFVDLAGRCPAPVEVQLDDDGKLSWGRIPIAQRYEVAAYSAVDGRTLAQAETLQPVFRVPKMGGPAYAMVRTRCASGYSAPVYQVLGTPRAR